MLGVACWLSSVVDRCLLFVCNTCLPLLLTVIVVGRCSLLVVRCLFDVCCLLFVCWWELFVVCGVLLLGVACFFGVYVSL